MNDFRASEGWLEKSVSRNVLSLRRRTTQAQKTPEQITDKVMSYILYVHQLKQRNNYDLDCITAMDETAVWHEMISNTIKDQLRKMYDQWMDEGPHTHTKEGNMCGHPLKQIVQWILKAWSDLDKEIIIKSFRCCALSIQDDGSEDNEIACFKPGKPLSSGLERLKAAIAEAAKELVDPFTESDIENDPDLLIDLDREGDEVVDIE